MSAEGDGSNRRSWPHGVEHRARNTGAHAHAWYARLSTLDLLSKQRLSRACGAGVSTPHRSFTAVELVTQASKWRVAHTAVPSVDHQEPV